ncbi:MAG: hypothetical protein ACI8P3_000829 [Saprospiraceae bacterium]|jgi:hypothetical protein
MDNPFGLPNATQSGENIFGCLINGEPWVAEVGVIAPGLHEVTSNYDEENFGVADNYYFFVTTNFLTSLQDSTKKDIFSINLRPIFSEGEVDFSVLTRKDVTFYTSLLSVTGTLKSYNLDTLHNNYFNITELDTLSNICAAKFNLQLISNTGSNSDTLIITEGRFDVIYQPD